MSDSVEEIFSSLESSFKAGVLRERHSFYFSIDDHKWTVVVDSESCSVERGKTVENADCFVKTSEEMFLKIYNGQISCPADFNGSGTVGVDDLFGFLDAWFAQFLAAPGMPSADFDNDLDVDVSDLFGFLDAWFMAFGSGC